MDSLKPNEIGQKIIDLSGIDIYKNTRKRNYVEMRALLCYLLREKLNMRWMYIANFFESNGKTMTHATAMHLVKQFDMYKKHNKQIEEFENMFIFKSNLNYDDIDKIHYLENKYNNLEKKHNILLEKLENPLVKEFTDLPEHKLEDVKSKLLILKKSWEWKKETN
tara:strand:- start:3110 stop:3604 length:495 start_codon:yes stop_codon:yes gene_type:complete